MKRCKLLGNAFFVLLMWPSGHAHAHWPSEAGLPEHVEGRLWHQVASHQGLRPMPLWLRAHDTRAASSLRHLGLDATEGEWISARWDAATLSVGLMAPGHLEILHAPNHLPMGQHSLRAIKGRDVQRGHHLAHAGLLGRGVLVGLIDTGIDLTHPAFPRADKTSRVVGIWDQDGHGSEHPPGFDYGTWCSEEKILAHRCHLKDWLGHGTHVAGIAAGNAHLVGGVAPAADIAVVQSHAFDHIADAALWLIQLAKARHQPLALNISVGGHYGPHDGLSPLEQFLAGQSRKGLVMVAAAGNEGDRPLHITLPGADTSKVQGLVRVALKEAPTSALHQPNAKATALLELWGSDKMPRLACAEIWHAGRKAASVPLLVSQKPTPLRWAGRTITVLRSREERRPSWIKNRARSDNSVGLSIAIEPVDPWLETMGATLVLAFERPVGEGPEVQGWLSASDGSPSPLLFGSPPVASAPGWLQGDAQASIAVPGTSPDILTVGSITVQNHWFDAGLVPRAIPHEQLGALSTFSSRGPTGAPHLTGDKPDLVAPGSVVVSARARSVAESPDTLGPITMVMQGTSMAAPHVTGTVALMLEAAPKLSQSEARALLQGSAAPQRWVLRPQRDGWGAGPLDAHAAASATLALKSGCQAHAPAPLQGFLAVGLMVRFTRRRRLGALSKRSAQNGMNSQQNGI